MIENLPQRRGDNRVLRDLINEPVISREARLLPGGVAYIIRDFSDYIDIAVKAVGIQVVAGFIPR